MVNSTRTIHEKIEMPFYPYVKKKKMSKFVHLKYFSFIHHNKYSVLCFRFVIHHTKVKKKNKQKTITPRNDQNTRRIKSGRQLTSVN